MFLETGENESKILFCHRINTLKVSSFLKYYQNYVEIKQLEGIPVTRILHMWNPQGVSS